MKTSRNLEKMLKKVQLNAHKQNQKNKLGQAAEVRIPSSFTSATDTKHNPAGKLKWRGGGGGGICSHLGSLNLTEEGTPPPNPPLSLRQFRDPEG